MVQLMSSAMAESKSKRATVKFELDDSSESREPLHKRPKFLSSPLQGNIGGDTCSVYNPLDEPSPLGLRLRKSPSLLDLIQMKLSQDKLANKTHKGSAAPDKLKAANFPASVLKIGTWQYKSRYEGDLVAKCYFAKHKLVWEVLDGSLKNKIEIQWSDIVALKASYSDDAPGTLNVVLARPPLFFRETNPQPRKHTLWQTTSDFTGGQASTHRRHFLQCPAGMLGKHFEKLMQCDPRLQFLSRQAEMVLDSPYFDPRAATTNGRPPIFGLQDATTSSSSSKTEHAAPPETYSSEISSGLKSGGAVESSMKVPGIHPSMSVSDLMSQIENCISGTDQQNDRGVLEEISQYLLSDSQLSLGSEKDNEQSLMSRVNSLCCLLQRAPSTTQLFSPKTDHSAPTQNPNSGEDCKQAQAVSRKDSFGDLLLSLPRIASLPQFLFNLSQDSR